MKSSKLGFKNIFILYPKAWIKNKNTGEVKWFESLTNNAEDAAAEYWAFFDRRDKMQNLGTSFFDVKTNNSMDNAQILDLQKTYLQVVSIKINTNTGVKKDPYNNITFEYLSSIFLGTPFGNKTSKGSELPGVIWGYGGGNFFEKQLPKTKIMSVGFKFLDIYLGTEYVGAGSDITSRERANAFNYFMTRTKSYIDGEVLFKIKNHKYL